MLHETKFVDDILNGVNIDPYEMRTYIRMLTRYYYGQGIVDQKEIRRLIFSWANKYKLYIKLSVKHQIEDEIDIYRPIGDYNVYISQDDIDMIKSYSRKKSLRKVMLGFVVYAKAFAINNIIDIRIKDFCKWVGVNNIQHFYHKPLKTLLDMGFIKDYDKVEKWKNNHITKCTRTLVVNFDVNYDGIYYFDNDNILDLYNKINWES